MTESIVRSPTVEGADQVVVRRARFEHPSMEPATVSFAHPRTDGAADPSVRPFLLAFLLPAMRLGDPLVVDGEVDEGTLQGLLEWQEAMARWHPGHLHVVPIRVELAPPRPSPTGAAPGRRAVVAFSGGLDSCFSAVRHRPGRPSEPGGPTHRGARVATGAMVHGFDIPLDQPETFASAYERSRRILTALAIAPTWVRTDVRALEEPFAISWETAAHAIWLVAALACLEDDHDLIVVPSSFAYDLQQLPWGSNPMTDPLLGSTTVPVWHDGSGVDRAGKAAGVAAFRAVSDDLRVCWQGDELDRNCGHCSKCLTTQAAFWASGVAHPAAFHDPGRVEELATIDVHHLHQRLLVRSLQEHASAIGRTDIVDALERALTPA